MILCHSGLPLHSLCSLASGAFTSVLGEGRTSFWDFLLAQCQLTPGAAGTVRSSEHPLHGQLRGGEVHLNYLWHDCFIAKLIENTLNVSQLTAPLLKQNCRADRGFILYRKIYIFFYLGSPKMQSLRSIYSRVVHFILRCVLPLQRCSCPVLTKNRDHTSYCSQLLSTENSWERRVFVIAVCSCYWTGPLLV